MTRILIIEDEVDVRKVVRKFLETKGYEVLEADNGAMGLDIFHRERVDLVITDIIMPQMEGLETIQKLRRHSPDVKIIAVSGGGRVGPDNYLNLAKKFGASSTLEKPFDMKQLVQTVEELLSNVESERDTDD
jgi:DNA-binding response OmpR family regulator